MTWKSIKTKVANALGFWTLEQIESQHTSPYGEWWEDYQDTYGLIDPALRLRYQERKGLHNVD